jgi:SAM-dependent methyltransferase
LYFSKKPARFGVALLVLLAIAARFPAAYGSDIFRGRSFFGVYRVTHDATAQRHLLFHGTTIHGSQNLALARKLQPLSYYHRTGPAGQVFDATAQRAPHARIGVIGLGTGALACHAVRGQQLTFFEIDPLVEVIARDARLFTFLRDCPPASDIVIGDARLSLEKVAAGYFDVLVLDAFSSDAIPIHLLTREAMHGYLRKTADGGLLLFHISNRHMDLAPVLDRIAKELGLAMLLQDDLRITPEQAVDGKIPSRWALLARRPSALEPFLADPRWRRLDGGLGGELWTDEFSDVLKVIRW